MSIMEFIVDKLPVLQWSVGSRIEGEMRVREAKLSTFIISKYGKLHGAYPFHSYLELWTQQSLISANESFEPRELGDGKIFIRTSYSTSSL